MNAATSSETISYHKTKLIFVNCLTALRIIFAVAFAILLLNEAPLWVCLVLYGLLEVTDVLDGNCARAWDVCSEWGARFDPFADSFARLTVYWTLGQAGLVFTLVVLVMAIRDGTVALSRQVLTECGQTVKARWSGKLKAVIQFVGVVVTLFVAMIWGGNAQKIVGETVSWVVMVATPLSAIPYIMAAIKAVKRKKAEEATRQAAAENTAGYRILEMPAIR